MIDLTRRKLLIGAAGLITAPVIVRAASLMPVKLVDLDPLQSRAVARVMDKIAEGQVFLTNNPVYLFLDIINDQGKSVGGRIDINLIGTAAAHCEERVNA